MSKVTDAAERWLLREMSPQKALAVPPMPDQEFALTEAGREWLFQSVLQQHGTVSQDGGVTQAAVPYTSVQLTPTWVDEDRVQYRVEIVHDTVVIAAARFTLPNGETVHIAGLDGRFGITLT